MDKKSFIEKSREIHKNIYSYEYVNFVNRITNVIIVCYKHGKFKQKPKYHVSGSGCPKCAIENRAKSCKLSIKDFILKSKLKHGNKYDYSNVNYINNKTHVEIICREHGIFKQRPSHHINGSSCPKCKNSYRMSRNEFIAKCKTIHNSYYDYSELNYKNIKSSIIIKCPIHGKFKQRAKHHISGSGCPKCQMSNGERKISKLLIKENIKFEYQYKFKECKDKRCLPFDFYLPEYNILIEYDGRQHYDNIKFFNNNLSLIQRRDKIKDNFAIKFNYKLIRLNKNSDINKIIKNIMEK